MTDFQNEVLELQELEAGYIEIEEFTFSIGISIGFTISLVVSSAC